MPRWDELHGNPRISYYLFLRRGYHYSATEAHARVKQMDAFVVVSLHVRPPEGWIRKLFQFFQGDVAGQPRLGVSAIPPIRLPASPQGRTPLDVSSTSR